MNVLVLMAGPGDAFREAGYHFPKNLIEINGLPLVEHVLRALRLSPSDKLICCVRQDENRQDHTGRVIGLVSPDAELVEVPGPTGGAVCTALLAISHINNDEGLMIVNGDQIVVADLGMITRKFAEDGLDGGVVVFEAVHPRWSYVRVDERGRVIEAAEKRPISNLATAGVYWFAHGADFVEAAKSLIVKDANTNGAFYVCPSYNELILKQKQIGIAKIPRESYVSLSTPDNVRAYETRLQAGAPG